MVILVDGPTVRLRDRIGMAESASAPMLPPTKACRDCERVLPDTEEHFRRHSRRADGTVRHHPRCLDCARAYDRRYYRAHPERKAHARRMYRDALADPVRRANLKRGDRRAYERRVAHMEADPEYAAQVRLRNAAAKRRYYARLRDDPDAWAAYLESARICYRLRREQRDGVPITDQRALSDVAMPHEPQHRLDGDPFREWLEDVFAGLGDWEAVATLTGLDARRIYAIRHEEFGSGVTLDTVDRALTSAGVPELLPALYPELYE